VQVLRQLALVCAMKTADAQIRRSLLGPGVSLSRAALRTSEDSATIGRIVFATNCANVEANSRKSAFLATNRFRIDLYQCGDFAVSGKMSADPCPRPVRAAALFALAPLFTRNGSSADFRLWSTSALALHHSRPGDFAAPSPSRR
jgi:hypothetical protein